MNWQKNELRMSCKFQIYFMQNSAENGFSTSTNFMEGLDQELWSRSTMTKIHGRGLAPIFTYFNICDIWALNKH